MERIGNRLDLEELKRVAIDGKLEYADLSSSDRLLYRIASVTPVLGVSDTCFRQSLAYINTLFGVGNGTKYVPDALQS